MSDTESNKRKEAEIEANIAAARARITRNVDALKTSFTPESLKRDLLKRTERAREDARLQFKSATIATTSGAPSETLRLIASATQRASKLVRNHPKEAALVSAGIATVWGILNATRKRK